MVGPLGSLTIKPVIYGEYIQLPRVYLIDFYPCSNRKEQFEDMEREEVIHESKGSDWGGGEGVRRESVRACFVRE